MIQPFDVLKDIPHFNGLSDDELESIFSLSTIRTFRKKPVVFHEGSPKEAVYFILEGLVKTFKTDENGNEVIVSFLKPHDMFPHTSFFDSLPYPATAETLVDCKIIAISIASLEQLISSHVSIAKNMMQMMSDKIRDLQETLQHITGQDVQSRTLLFLNKLMELYGTEKDGSIYIPMPMTNQELASATGTTRETVNRLLNQLRKEQIVEFKSDALVILRPAALVQGRTHKS